MYYCMHYSDLLTLIELELFATHAIASGLSRVSGTKQLLTEYLLNLPLVDFC